MHQAWAERFVKHAAAVPGLANGSDDACWFACAIDPGGPPVVRRRDQHGDVFVADDLRCAASAGCGMSTTRTVRDVMPEAAHGALEGDGSTEYLLDVAQDWVPPTGPPTPSSPPAPTCLAGCAAVTSGPTRCAHVLPGLLTWHRHPHRRASCLPWAKRRHGSVSQVLAPGLLPAGGRDTSSTPSARRRHRDLPPAPAPPTA